MRPGQLQAGGVGKRAWVVGRRSDLGIEHGVSGWTLVFVEWLEGYPGASTYERRATSEVKIEG
jgi:hypothetical protein